VLFTDDQVTVFDKPAGLPVTPGAGCQDRTLVALARRLHDPGLAPVHRLDVGTSGVVVFARTADARRFLCSAFRHRRVEKTYLARVIGRVALDAFDVDVPIGPVPFPPLGWISGACHGGRPALTHVRILRRDEDETLVEARPVTGRSQQIRIHLAAAGHPVAGDPMYVAGGIPGPWREGDPTVKPGDCGYLLHAWWIRFPHPRDGGIVEVEAPPPSWVDADRS
jgi:23S rRNA pseudouridine1911/1915/1917 synthase